MVVAVALSVCIPSDNITLAAETVESKAVEELVITEETIDTNDTETTEQTEDTDKKEESEQAEKAEEKAASSDSNIVGEMSTAKEEKDSDINLADRPVLRSLLPLKEVKAYLVASDYSEEEIQAMPLSTILNSLRDSKGNSIEIPETATAVWTYFKDENNNLLQDEYHVIGRDEKVDLSLFEYTKDYTMELIIGSGNQLDPGNVRYLVKVYLTNTVTEEINTELYTQGDDGIRQKIMPDKMLPKHSTVSGIDMTTVMCLVPTHVVGAEYYLGISSIAAEHPDITVDIYTMEEFQKFLITGSGAPITDQILNQDMTKNDAGYKGIYDAPTDINDWKNMFWIVYTDTATDAVMSFEALSFGVEKDMSYVTSNIATYDDQQMKDIVCRKEGSVDINDFTVNMGNGSVGAIDAVYGEYFMLKDGYHQDAEYYCTLDAHSNIWDDANSHVEKAVVGLYDSLDDAADQTDIKEQLIPADKNTIPYGYKANYNYENGGVNFTVFFDDGNVWKFNVRIMGYNPEYDTEYMQSFNDAPIVGAKDPWFRVDGVKQGGKLLDTYVVENGKAINMDTEYGYGYQTVFINDKDVDLTSLSPIFWFGNADRVETYVGSKQESGVSIQDFSEGAVQYSTIIDKNVKNYQLTVVKKETGPKLYVNGPSERTIFLDEYFEYKHDILIANVGDETLRGLKVKLDAANVKLDDYWTVGGENNDTLAAFTTTTPTTEYGELANIAKIRLLPDGNGKIEGTLTISADGQDDVVINLNGRAKNPTIVTKGLNDAVKYVPYSYVVATDNMNDWNSVTFSIESGTLPEGLELYPTTGEIYGVPQESGEYHIRVKATYGREDYFEPSYADLILNVKDNTNDNVYNATDEGYDILESIGVDEAGNYDFVLSDTEDQLFVSSGEFEEFQDLWLNGEKLTEGEDYTKVKGSTRITIRSQTFKNKVNQNGPNTIAAEFRVDGDTNKNLKRTAQNFRMNISQGSNSGNGSYGGNNSVSNVNTSGDGTNNSATAWQAPYVTMSAYIVDTNDNPISNATVEVHSRLQSVRTDENGIAKFRELDFGDHTITIKAKDGSLLGEKNFKIKSGTKLQLNGDTITAPKGSVFMLKVKVDNGELTFQTVQLTRVATGDGAKPWIWCGFIMIAGAALVESMMYRKKKVRDE